jgi:Uma2 family endonuclease
MSAVLTPQLPTRVTPLSVTPTQVPTLPPRPFRWTLKQYRQLGKTGLFDNAKPMLIDGEIFLMVMPNPPHDTSLGKIDDWLRTVFTTGHSVRCQMGFDIGEDTDPGPDLAVVPGTRDDYRERTPTSAVLIVEVADSSLFFDTTTKAEKYATAKVPEYWVIDLENRQVIVFRDPVPLPAALGANAYRQRTTLGPTDTISPHAAPHASVTVADLLPAV